MASIGDAPTYSDEPTRISEIVHPMYRDEHFKATVDDGSAVSLTAGVDAGDDCAVFRFDGRQDLVVGSDYVRGPKFRLYEYGLLDDFDLGYYLVMANVSDVAAMGAVPIGFLSVVRYPSEMDDSRFSSVMRGIKAACADVRTPVVGGDIGGAERLILSGTALGVCRSGRSLMRSGARPGDRVFVSGRTGTAGAAMAYFSSGRRDEEIDGRFGDVLLDSWRRPRARTDMAELLGASTGVTSCQDTSDGLKAAVETIAESSSVRLTVDESSIDVPAEVDAVCRFLERDPMAVVFGDSVDFELVFTVDPDHVDDLRGRAADRDLDLIEIGVVDTGDGASLRLSSGESVAIPGSAWRHAPDPTVPPGK